MEKPKAEQPIDAWKLFFGRTAAEYKKFVQQNQRELRRLHRELRGEDNLTNPPRSTHE